MAFLDNIGKKLSTTGQSAVQKTNDMVGVARFNAAISEEERNINNNYIQLGRKYAEIHSLDYEDAFAAFMMAIQESKGKILDYQQQIRELRGLVVCQSCGAENPNSFAFCSSCGAPLPRRENVAGVSLVRCTGCGSMVPRDSRFCTECGKPISESIQEQANASAGQRQGAESAGIPAQQAANADASQMYAGPDSAQQAGNMDASQMYAGPDLAQQTGNMDASQMYAGPDLAQAGTIPAADGGNAMLADTRTCPNCGAAVDSASNFCTTCGTPL